MATETIQATDHKLYVAGEWMETGEWSEVKAPYDGTLVGRVPKGDGALVDKATDAAAGAFAAGGFPQHERAAVLDRAARLVAEHPDRFIGFADINAQSVCNLWDAAQELEYAVKELGLRGLKIHPNNLNMMVDDYRLIPVFRKAADLKIPIIVHCYPPGGPGFVDCSYPEGISRMARVFDDAKIIASHLGGTKHMELLRAVRMVEISAGLFDLVNWYGDEGAARVLRAFGPRRLIFGTDYGACHPERYFAVLDRMGFSEDEMKLIAKGNIERMLAVEE
jgi:predicted TIM-barrel fold metal-dependent hydrolase